GAKAQRCEKEGSDRVSEGYLTAQLIGTESIRMRWSKNESDLEACIAHLRFPVSGRSANLRRSCLETVFHPRSMFGFTSRTGKFGSLITAALRFQRAFVSFL